MPSERNEKTPATEDKEVYDPPGWRIAVGYGLASAIMLVLAVIAYSNYLSAEHAKNKAIETLAIHAESTLAAETSISVLMSDMTRLSLQISNIINTDPLSKDDMLREIGKTQQILLSLKNLIETTRSLLSGIKFIRADGDGSFQIVRPAFAQSTGHNSITNEVKIVIALLSLFVIVLVISYFLWMIARPSAPTADKKMGQRTFEQAAGFSWRSCCWHCC